MESLYRPVGGCISSDEPLVGEFNIFICKYFIRNLYLCAVKYENFRNSNCLNADNLFLTFIDARYNLITQLYALTLRAHTYINASNVIRTSMLSVNMKMSVFTWCYWKHNANVNMALKRVTILR